MYPANYRSAYRSALRVALLSTVALAASAAHAADTNRTIVSRVAPVYPELAKRMHVSGVVVLHVTVAPDGTVSQTTAASGHPCSSTPPRTPSRNGASAPAPSPPSPPSTSTSLPTANPAASLLHH